MSPWNLPESWGPNERCHRCDRPYHPSGTVECACRPCSSCDDPFPPDDLDDGRCEACRTPVDVECDLCAGTFGVLPVDARADGGLCDPCEADPRSRALEFLSDLRAELARIRRHLGLPAEASKRPREVSEAVRAVVVDLNRLRDERQAVLTPPSGPSAGPQDQTQPTMRAASWTFDAQKTLEGGKQ